MVRQNVCKKVNNKLEKIQVIEAQLDVPAERGIMLSEHNNRTIEVTKKKRCKCKCYNGGEHTTPESPMNINLKMR